jgi:hypothetical protein
VVELYYLGVGEEASPIGGTGEIWRSVLFWYLRSGLV